MLSWSTGWVVRCKWTSGRGLSAVPLHPCTWIQPLSIPHTLENRANMTEGAETWHTAQDGPRHQKLSSHTHLGLETQHHITVCTNFSEAYGGQRLSALGQTMTKRIKMAVLPFKSPSRQHGGCVLVNSTEPSEEGKKPPSLWHG